MGSGAFGDAWRRQAPEAAKQRAVADRGDEPGLERRDRAERGAALGQPEFGAAVGFAADAHDCIMVRIQTDLPDTDPMQCGKLW